MNWTNWMLASAAMLAFYDLAKKASVRENAVLPTLLFSTIAGCAAYLATLCAAGRLGAAADAATPEIVSLAAAKSAIVAASWVFTFKALRTLPISIATPIRASAPALVFIIAFFLYGERPGAWQAAGMATVFAGYFAFSWAGRHEGIDFLRNRAVWCAFAGMCLSACSAIWDKYIFQIRGADVEAVQFLFQIGLVAVYAALLACRRLLGMAGEKFEWRWTIPLVGILLAGADWLYFRGISGDGVPISVASLMRRFSVVITFILGAKFFNERNLVRKGIALAAILLGVAMLALG
ncbi:MAG: DMT family transporter [Kiritimatiellae bacterium]|nr:DMT family transporter [Kiritimatiellia bacterium]